MITRYEAAMVKRRHFQYRKDVNVAKPSYQTVKSCFELNLDPAQRTFLSNLATIVNDFDEKTCDFLRDSPQLVNDIDREMVVAFEELE